MYTITFTKEELEAISHSINASHKECDGCKADFWYDEPHISVEAKIKEATDRDICL